MRVMLTGLAVLAVGCNPGSERTPDARLDQSARSVMTDNERKAVEDTVRKLVQSTAAAQNKGDIKPIRGYYAPSAISIQSGQVFRNIDSLFEGYETAMKSAGGALPKVSVDVERVDVLAPDAAVATTRSQGSIDSAGRDLKWAHMHTGVWQNRDGQWRVLLEHASLVPDTTAK
jgi:uncharacterized protein (TIGR02246 family)